VFNAMTKGVNISGSSSDFKFII